MNKRNKVGIIIGRFQTKRLHEGHIALYNAVKERSDEVLIFIGCGVPKSTNRNPMDFKTRELMVRSTFPEVAEVVRVNDYKINERWSENIDQTIMGLTLPDDEVTLYGSRDSFIPFYRGKYSTVELLHVALNDISATAERLEIAKEPIDSEDFRSGVIYDALNKYPVAYPCIDIAVINRHYQVLLGRKPDETLFRFIGGFVDPTDQSMEDAAYRECREEAGESIILEDIKYITSMKVHDWRYRGTSDGVITTFFVAKYMGGEIVASDDIVEVKFFNYYDLLETEIVEEHRPLFKKFKEFLQKDY